LILIADVLLNPFKTQQEIADEYYVSQNTISLLKTDIISKMASIAKFYILDENDRETEVAKIELFQFLE
jgi:hypothetical protein